jgi:cysteine synthase A
MASTLRSGATILDVIGSTPLLDVDGIWLKLEYLNPSGSIKARMARYIIERAEREGLLHPGDTIVEASSGNTGNAMSMVAAVKGYKMLVVMPVGMSPERAAISTAFGAQLMTVGDFHVNEALELAGLLGDRSGYFAPHQFESEWNVEENRTWLGPEIIGQLPAGRSPDAFVMGVGTGGTLIGVGQAMRAVNPGVLIVGLEPSESCTILCGDTGLHRASTGATRSWWTGSWRSTATTPWVRCAVSRASTGFSWGRARGPTWWPPGVCSRNSPSRRRW